MISTTYVMKPKHNISIFLSVAMDTNVGTTRTLGSTNISDITTKNAKMCYEKWCEKGIHMANHVMSVSRVLVNYGIQMEYCNSNPFSNVKKRTPEQKSHLAEGRCQKVPRSCLFSL